MAIPRLTLSGPFGVLAKFFRMRGTGLACCCDRECMGVRERPWA
jgi:hypothetical protein